MFKQLLLASALLSGSSHAATTYLAPVTQPAGDIGTGGAAGMPALGVCPNYEYTCNGIPTKGFDAASIHSQFVANMNYAFDPAMNDAWTITNKVGQISQIEWARMSMLYVIEGGDLQTLSDLIAQTQSVPQMYLLSGIFGKAIVASSMARVASPANAQWYASLAQYGALPAAPRSVAMYQSMGLDPKQGIKSAAAAAGALDFTLYELYLDFRTAAGGMSVASALWSTGQVASLQLGKAFALGYAVGQGALWIGDQLSPGFSEWLASELGAAMQDALNIPITLPSYVFTSVGCGCSITIQWDYFDNDTEL